MKRSKAIGTLVFIGLWFLCVQTSLPAQAQKYGSEAPYGTEKIADNLYTFHFGGHRNIFLVTDDGVIATDPFDGERREIFASRNYQDYGPARQICGLFSLSLGSCRGWPNFQR